jgi:hydroxyacylglutathione hydrolase
MSDRRGGPGVARREPSLLDAVTFDALGLGDRTYLLHDDAVAVVVDPQRDPQPYLETAARLGVRITHVLETHIHNDYVSGGLALARRAGATYVLPRGEKVAFADERLALGDRQHFITGTLRVQALSTPGHTPHHLSYLVESTRAPLGTGGYVCTGGSLLGGGSGRTDLSGEELVRPLARAQWESVRRLLVTLDETTVVLPTHGFGSFCSSTPAVDAGDGVVTIALERTRNPVARRDLDEFVRDITEDRPPIPRHYHYMGALNRAGAREVRTGQTAIVSATSLTRVLERDGYVVDLRPRRAYAGRHRIGTLNIELGVNLTTYFGWLVPFDAQFSLIAESPEEIEEARALIARIGRDEIAGWAPSTELLGAGQGIGTYPVATFADLAHSASGSGLPSVLDVRHPSEWRAGHLREARHLPLPELAAARSALPDEGRIWVHCAAGFRAAIAASMLAAVGRSPVLIDDLFANAAPAGLEIETGERDCTGTGDVPIVAR